MSKKAAVEPTTRFQIVVCNGPQRGTVVSPRGRTFLIGRAPECDLRLEDAYVSRHHCLLELVEDEWWLRDLGSRNGTWVGEQRVDRPFLLTPGTVFRVGRTHLLCGPVPDTSSP